MTSIATSGNYSISVVDSSGRSITNCHKCDKKVHIQRLCKSKGHGSSNIQYNKSTNELQAWVTKKTFALYTKDLATVIVTCKSNEYKWCTYFNHGNGARVFHWKYGHKKWKDNKGRNNFFFTYYASNTIIYCSHIMETSDYYTEEEHGGGEDSQKTDFITLINFDLIELLIKRLCLPY